jgi:hypothetical protein
MRTVFEFTTCNVLGNSPKREGFSHAASIIFTPAQMSLKSATVTRYKTKSYKSSCEKIHIIEKYLYKV